MKYFVMTAGVLALSLAAIPPVQAQKAGGVRSTATGTVPGGEYRAPGNARTQNGCTRRQCHWHR
jgi:hypothetical protein